VTTFQLQQEIDTGDILLQESFPIGEDETAGEVHDKMKEIGANVLVQTLRGLFDGSVVSRPQPATITALKHAPKIFTETAQIDFSKSVADIHNLIRGLSPFPGAFTMLDGKTCKIFKSEKEVTQPTHAPGEYDTDGKTYLRFAAIDGYIRAKEIQLEGKKRIEIGDFLRGYRFANLSGE
jgi:methionyl-tRNA formyltransferase